MRPFIQIRGILLATGALLLVGVTIFAGCSSSLRPVKSDSSKLEFEKAGDGSLKGRLQLFLECLKPGQEEQISAPEKQRCAILARSTQEPNVSDLDFTVPPSYTLHVRQWVTNLFLDRNQALYEPLLQMLMQEGLAKNRDATFFILGQAQLYWEAKFNDPSALVNYRECAINTPATYWEKQRVAAQMGGMFLPVLHKLGSRFNLLFKIPFFIQDLGAGVTTVTANHYIQKWSDPSQGAFAKNCQTLPPSPAQLTKTLWYRSSDNQDINRNLELELGSEVLTYEKTKLIGTVLMLIPVDILGGWITSSAIRKFHQSARGQSYRQWQQKLEGKRAAVRVPLKVASKSIYLAGMIALYHVLIEVLYIPFDKGFSAWHWQDRKKATESALATVESLRAATASTESLMVPLSILSQQTFLTSYYLQSGQQDLMKESGSHFESSQSGACFRTPGMSETQAINLLTEIQASYEQWDRACNDQFNQFFALQDQVFLPDKSKADLQSVAKALSQMKTDWGQRFARHQFCKHPGALLLQLASYLETFPEELRLPFSLQAQSAAREIYDTYRVPPSRNALCVEHENERGQH